jgi:tetratricopeptide (TPR) repeat protein
MQGVLYSALGNLYRQLLRLDEAITLYQSAIQCHEGTGTPLEQGHNYQGLGWIYLSQSKLIEAECYGWSAVVCDVHVVG